MMGDLSKLSIMRTAAALARAGPTLLGNCLFLRACLSRKLKFSNVNTKANVFEFMFENRVF
jgi:hypothetical protein